MLSPKRYAVSPVMDGSMSSFWWTCGESAHNISNALYVLLDGLLGRHLRAKAFTHLIRDFTERGRHSVVSTPIAPRRSDRARNV